VLLRHADLESNSLLSEQLMSVPVSVRFERQNNVIWFTYAREEILVADKLNKSTLKLLWPITDLAVGLLTRLVAQDTLLIKLAAYVFIVAFH
jgi:hypothetical protein